MRWATPKIPLCTLLGYKVIFTQGTYMNSELIVPDIWKLNKFKLPQNVEIFDTQTDQKLRRVLKHEYKEYD